MLVFERAGEVAGIAVADFVGDLGNVLARPAEQLGGALHSLRSQIAENRRVVKIAKAFLQFEFVQVHAPTEPGNAVRLM